MSVVLYEMELSPPCMAVLTTAKIIGVKVECKRIDINKSEHLTESYKKLNPAHSIPTLEDKGFHIWESRAILCYLVQQYAKDDKLYPKDIKKRALVDNMLYFDGTALYESISNYIYPHVFYKKPLDPGAEVAVKDRLSILDGILAKKSFVAGGDQPTLADISIRCSLICPIAFGYSLEPYANIGKWIARFDAAVPFFKEFAAHRVKRTQDLFKHMIAAQISIA